VSELILRIWANSLERLGGILEPTLGAQEKNGQVRQTTAQEHFAFSPLRKWGTIALGAGIGLGQPEIAQADKCCAFSWLVSGSTSIFVVDL
jgi:hypothetical protein